MKKCMWIITAVVASLFIVEAEAAPVFQAAGTAVTGTGSVSPAWPAHAINDVALLFIESTGGQVAALSPASGFVAVTNSPQATGTGSNGTRITVYWARAISSAMPSPTVTDPGDHVYAQIITYRGVTSTGNPWDITGGGVKATASTTVSVSGITTTIPDTLIVQAVSRDNDRTGTAFSGETNANLTGIAERSDGGTASGNGGGFAVWDGVKATAGATGNTTATISRSTVNAFLSIALKPVSAALDHIEIDYPAPPFSTCSPTTVQVYACTNAACSPYYTGGVSVTLSPGGNVVTIPSGSGSGSGTVFQTGAGAATLDAVSAPAELTATTCKNTSTNTFSCSVNFLAASLSVTVPNLVSGNTVTGSVSGCKAQLPAGANTINFYTAYQNPASGSKQATINATTVATSSPGTPISLNFDGASPSSSASFTLSYPDVGGVGLTATKGSSNGSSSFVVVPHHFALSNINCLSGCIAASNPGTASNASGAVFMKAGNPFSMFVTAYNSAGAVTPNFGLETPAENVSLTWAANMTDIVLPAVPFTGILTGSFGVFSGGSASGNPFTYDEAGIMTITVNLYDPDAKGYLSIGNQLLNPVGAASVNIGRFIPDHFEVNPDALNPILARAVTTQTIAIASVTVAPATVINVSNTAGFYVGSKVRIPGAGAGGAAFTATVTAVNAAGLTLTLDTAIGATLNGGESVIDEWGSYMGEAMNAIFDLTATDLIGNITQNYDGNYAKLKPNATGNPLGFGAVSAGVDLTARLSPVSAASGVFTAGIASVIAPLVISRGASPDGPYAALQIGIAPTTAESDGVRMGTYDLNVGGANDHTSIMDPLVQNVTAVRYGRIKIANATGSELLPLSIPLTAQYWDGAAYATNVNDSLTAMLSSNILLSNYQKNLTAGATTISPAAPTPIAFTSGAGNITLSAPGAGKNGSVDMSDPVLTGASCSVVPIPLGCYLPSSAGRATFGVYKGNSMFIYQREIYY